ncbi:hypothetical protein [Flavobacterium salmonis]|uniref:Lipoprotein n=1 Tax=Flavobacterium salmonis TaxID=2654844 RepID=A0A6V6ZDE9_9FLAO|nr:hypothetical protein [Flavobacterium salmonis]CAD0009679.1 hypothetical protein FLAT13_05056 [Flavobacterium salmonis]
MTRKFYSLLVLPLLLISCNTYSNKNLVFDNVLLLYSNSYNENTSYKILNINKTIYSEIKSVKGNEPTCEKIKSKILAYYSDYYIFHFEARKSTIKGFYEIKVGDEVKLIKEDVTMKFLTLKKYILSFYCKATKENPLLLKPASNSKKINIDFENTSFNCITIDGDWVKVRCNNNCEGCPNKKIFEGWIRWKKNGSIVLKLFYSC